MVSGRSEPGPASGALAGSQRLAYPALLALGAIDAAAYSLIAPVSPAIAEATGAGPAVIGLLVASFPLAMIAGFAVAAHSVERGRTTPVLRASLLIVGIGTLGFVFGHGLAAYFGARLLMGLGSGGLWIGVVFSTLERWPGEEYLCMSRVFSAYAIGGLVGPALGAIGGISGPFLAYLVLVAAGIGVTALMGDPAARRAFHSDRSVLRVRTFWLASAGVLFVYVGYGAVEGILPLHLAEGLSQTGIGLSFVAMSLVVGAASALGGDRRPRALVVASVALVATGLLAAGLTSRVSLWLVALALIGVGLGLGTTGSMGILLRAVATERIVTAIVTWSQIGIVGYLLGPLAGGMAVEAVGFAGLGLAPLAGGALVVAMLAYDRRAGAGT